VLRIYTRTGDDGTTGLLYGGRVAKDDPIMQINGAVDEAQAAMGMARAEAEPQSELDRMLTSLERDLYVLMAEVATDADNHRKLKPGQTLVTQEMVESLVERIDDLKGRFGMPAEFVVPGANRGSAALDMARTVVRRAERLWVSEQIEGSEVGRYLNRLSDLLWTMARWVEGDHHLLARGAPRRGKAASDTATEPGPSTGTSEGEPGGLPS
jgi:cob(I)alamin adenosyltransferase